MTSSAKGPGATPSEPTSAVRPTGERTTLPGGKAGLPAPEPPARITLPGGSVRPAPPPLPQAERSTAPGPASGPDATIKIEAMDLPDEEIDPADFERVTLIDLPAIARYGRYDLLGRIAYGGMAEIFLAREGHDRAQRLLVIKRVLPHVAEDQHFVNMFVDEARLAMQLNHPNICHVYSFGEEDGTWYIAMEWVNGKPLSKIIRRARELGGLPIPVALKIIGQIAEALDYAHRACDGAGEPLGIVHRDVSPQNIMVSYDGTVKLLDFGIAKATSHSTRTEAGVIKGKFAYMSPQQCVGEVIDGRADIFALGVCLFETLTSRNPFRRKTEFETMTRIVGDPTPFARDRRAEITEEVDEILQRALMKQPERRFQTAGDMQLAIETVLPKLGGPMNASRLGEYVAHLFKDEVKEGPELDMRVSVPPRRPGSDEHEMSAAPRPAGPGATVADVSPFAAPQPKKRSAFGLIAMGLVAVFLCAISGAGAMLAWTVFQPRVETPREIVRLPAMEPPIEPAVVREPAPANVAPQMGSVFVESLPSGATIQIDDRENAGTTPIEIGTLEPGTRTVTIRREGYEPWTGTIDIVAGGRATVNAPLVPVHRALAAPPGELALNTQPWSKVYLGSRLLGTTPIRVTVPSGTQRLRLVDRDGNEHRRTVRIAPGAQASESFDLRTPEP